jgi:D-glycero-alpha-D-manno-heptose-7-phosphate kinase
VRGVLKYLGMEHGIEVHHTGDLPARSGLGSSSAFTVGLLNALQALQGQMSSKRELACEAVHIERNVLKENVGVQDQIATAFGGFNKITILPNGEFKVDPVILRSGRMQELQRHFMLFFTGVSRTASDVAKEQIKATSDKKAELHAMRQLVDDALTVLGSDEDITEFGHLLHETWQLKRSLASGIAPGFVDDIYAKARAAGAIGGKLLGAGGGGFILFFVPPEKHMRVLDALKDLLWVPFEFESTGTSIVYYDQNSFSRTALTRRDFYHLQERQEAPNAMQEADTNVISIGQVARKRLLTV